MDADSFFTRWAKRKAEAAQDAPAPAAEPQPGQPAAEQAPEPLTLDDVAQLTPESDYAPFIARGVDESVKRSALKKLFSDPRFNVMDGLDTYIDDYNQFEPIPPAMLAALNHAKDLLNPLGLADDPAAPEEPPTSAPEITPTEPPPNQPADDDTI
jgi:hypothetical protein